MQQMLLNEDEIKIITDLRKRREKENWILTGMLNAAQYLRSLGDQCAGGSGQQPNPKTGSPFGEFYYTAATLIEHEIARKQTEQQGAAMPREQGEEK